MLAMLPALLLSSTLPRANLSRISTNGTSLIAAGQPILLKGVNLGGWLVEEPWMTPWRTTAPKGSPEPAPDNHTALWGLLTKRFGEVEMEKIRTAWRDNWITDSDFQVIKAAGFNHVRIPFLVSILDEPGGLATLHKAVSMATKAGLYVVLDMHGAPGGQSNEAHNGLGKSNQLWFDPKNIEAFEKAWSKVAGEFPGPEVAMFDIMNEPMGAPNPAMLNLVYDRVIRAIRRVNRDTVVLVEDGYKGFETTPHPNVPGWTNVAFSLHFYDFNAKVPQDHIVTLESDIKKDAPLEGFRNAPLYIGEFNLEPQAGPEVTHQFVSKMSAQGWSWTIWTWKAESVTGSVGQWGVLRPKNTPQPIDPFVDTEESILAKIPNVQSSNFEPVPGLLDALTH